MYILLNQYMDDHKFEQWRKIWRKDCYTSQLKYVFWLDENVSRAIGQNYLTP